MTKSFELRVKHSGVVPVKFFRDLPDGNLFISEGRKNIDFDIKRVYFINNLANHKAVRGMHAHRKLEQVIFCINGSFTLHLDDGVVKQRIKLSDPALGIRVGPMLWHSMSSFSYDCVILVLASDYFDESDYIRDYDVFLQAAKAPEKH